MLLRFINGSNDSREYLQKIFEYITSPGKTSPEYIVTTGCLGKNPIQDFLTTKKLYHKTGGKQAEHFVLSFYPDKPEVSDKELVSIANEIVKANYPEFQSITAIHKDTNVRHTHTIINSVNAVNGRKFSQSNTDLNKVKTKTNEILKTHNMEVIKMSANNFTDKNNYNNEDNFDYLEIEENEDMYRDLINADEVIDRWNQNNSQNDDDDYTGTDDNNCYYSDDTEEEQYLPVNHKKKRKCTFNIETAPIYNIQVDEDTDLSEISDIIDQTRYTLTDQQVIYLTKFASDCQEKLLDEDVDGEINLHFAPTVNIDMTSSKKKKKNEEDDYIEGHVIEEDDEDVSPSKSNALPMRKRYRK